MHLFHILSNTAIKKKATGSKASYRALVSGSWFVLSYTSNSENFTRIHGAKTK